MSQIFGKLWDGGGQTLFPSVDSSIDGFSNIILGGGAHGRCVMEVVTWKDYVIVPGYPLLYFLLPGFHEVNCCSSTRAFHDTVLLFFHGLNPLESESNELCLS